MRKLPARKLLGAVVAAALLLPSSGFTLGLGEIEVNSALNQKLNADIELLSAAPEDAEGIIIKLASRKEFSRAGIDRPYLLNDLRFKSEIINGVPYIKVTSGSPIREPFLNFLVEIDWPNGHLLREYTVLLDPPVFMTQPASLTSSAASQASDNGDFRPSASSANAAPVTAPAVSLSPRPSASVQAVVPQNQPVAPAAVARAPASTQSTWIPAPVLQQQVPVNQPAGTYKIKNGDTAWSLADAMRPDRSITVPQMMVAMLRANPESFIDGNINGLKRGYILRVPDYDQVTSISPSEAQALVNEQAALWRQYQQSQAGGAPTSAMEQEDEPAPADAAGSGAAAPQDDAYLEIVSAGESSSTLGGKDPTQMTAQELRAELALARERVETELVEKEALQQRVQVLESNVNKMKGMLAIEDAELAAVESLGQPGLDQAEELMSTEAAAVEDEMAEAEMPEAEMPEAEMAVEAQLDGATTEEADLAADTMDKAAEAEATDPESVETMADEALLTKDAALAEGESAEEAVFSDEVTEEADAALAEMQDQVLPQDMAAADDMLPVESQMADREPTDLLSKLLNNPVLLAAAGGGLLLITALIGLIIKRRKSATETAGAVTASGFDDLEELAEDVARESAEMESAAAADILADEDKAAASDFDSDATMILDSAEDTVITEAASSTAEAEEEVRDDVIAEADVYLAYGIYQQAEELLTQAISDNPDRDDYRVKLAETHFASKNADAFTQVASQIKDRVDSNSATWKKVLSMGQDLSPDNPMFQGDMVGDGPGLDLDSIAPAAPEMDFDLGVDDSTAESGSESPDLDLSQDDEPLELPEMEGEAQEEETIAQPVDELEFDLSDTGAIEEPEAVEEDEFSLDIDASELDIDIENEAEAVTAAVEEEVASADDVDIDFGLGEESGAADAVEEEEEISLDLTQETEALDMDLGLDLDEAAASAEAASAEADTEAAPIIDLSDTDEEDFDLSSLDDVDEISTKLDLARAYLDMGDHEGSRGILEEVIAEGSDEQKQEAKELMDKLD